MPDNPPAARSACVGDHHYAHHLRGGEPLSIPICTLCGEIGWDDIREQIATAVLPTRRAMVLREAADELATEIAWQREKYGDGTDRVATGRLIGMEDAATTVRRLAATAPPVPPASTVEPENAPLSPRGWPIQFWACPISGHSDRRGPNGGPIVTVEWDGDVAHCTAPGCGRSSDNEQGCNCEEYDCDGSCCGGQCTCAGSDPADLGDDHAA